MLDFFGDKKGQNPAGSFLGNLPFFRDKKGQEGYVFRLFVGAVVAVAIIGIILVLINKTEEQKTYLSIESLITNLKYAVKAPTQEEYVIDKVIIKKGTYFSKPYLEEETNLPKHCIKLTSKIGAMKEDQDGLYAEKDLETSVKVVCFSNIMGCEIFCEITFG